MLLQVGRAVPKLFFPLSGDCGGSASLSAPLGCCRLDWPVRTLSFSHDGKMLASASEDHFIDIAEVETGNSFILGGLFQSKEGIGWKSAGGAGRAQGESVC